MLMSDNLFWVDLSSSTLGTGKFSIKKTENFWSHLWQRGQYANTYFEISKPLCCDILLCQTMSTARHSKGSLVDFLKLRLVFGLSINLMSTNTTRYLKAFYFLIVVPLIFTLMVVYMILGFSLARRWS